MLQSLALYIGLRYTRARRRNRFISFFSLISIVGLAIGVCALITVISVMNGFEKELRQRMLQMAAHVEVLPLYSTLEYWPSLAEEVKRLQPRVLGAAPYIQGQGMVTHGQSVYGAILQGLDPTLEGQVSSVQQHLLSGSLDDLKTGEFNVIIGAELQMSLGVVVGDKITVVVPQASVTPVGLLPRMKRMTVAGVFRIGMHEFDSGVVLMNLEDAARLLRLPEGHVHGLNLKLDDMDAANQVSRQLREQLPDDFRPYPWTYRHANFFRAIKMEKTVMFIILTLIVAVAAFNIISTLVMLVTDKQADIAILRTLGVTPRTVMGIFVVQGLVIGVVGTALGTLGGVALALNIETLVPAIERLFDTQFLSPDVYYISDVPSDLHWNDVFRITGISLLISLLATLYPALRAARTRPAEALRYE